MSKYSSWRDCESGDGLSRNEASLWISGYRALLGMCTGGGGGRQGVSVGCLTPLLYCNSIYKNRNNALQFFLILCSYNDLCAAVDPGVGWGGAVIPLYLCHTCTVNSELTAGSAWALERASYLLSSVSSPVDWHKDWLEPLLLCGQIHWCEGGKRRVTSSSVHLLGAGIVWKSSLHMQSYGRSLHWQGGQLIAHCPTGPLWIHPCLYPFYSYKI